MDPMGSSSLSLPCSTSCKHLYQSGYTVSEKPLLDRDEVDCTNAMVAMILVVLYMANTLSGVI
jgi:hypothetical protein